MKGLVALSVILALLYSASNMMILPLLEDLSKEISNKNFSNFNNHIRNAFVLFTLKALFNHSQYYLVAYMQRIVKLTIQNDIYKKCVQFSQHFYTQWKTGDIVSRMFTDTANMTNMIALTFWELIPQVLTLIGIVGYLIYLNPLLTLLSLIVAPVIIWLTINWGTRLKRLTHQVQRKVGNLTHFTQETLSNMKLIQAYTAEKIESDRFNELNRQNVFLEIKGIRLRSLSDVIIELLQTFTMIGVLWYAGSIIAKGEFTGPQLIAYFGGIVFLINPVIALSKAHISIQQAMASTERVDKLINAPVLIKNSPDAVALSPMKGSISLKDMSFSYSTKKSSEKITNVLNGISLDIKENETIALVGLSGAGKTTLINLIPRFYDVTGGHLLIDGIDVKNIDLHSLRSQIALVPQEDFLFQGTILENIKYGNQNASLEEVEHAAELAHAKEFIDKMKGKFNSHVGNQGRKLSTGQKQRISFARAVLKNPKVLILDEPTSALDSESEKHIQLALTKLMKNRTTIVIAHRLSTIRHADRIVVLDKGKISDIGHHDELIAREGIYKKLYDIQFSTNF